MADDHQRYSRLEPLSIKERTRLSLLATQFFSPLEYREMCALIGKSPAPNQIEPLNGRDFLEYLKTTKQLQEPDRYMFRIGDLLSQLAKAHILRPYGSGPDVFIGTHYYFLRELTKREQEGHIWLAEALGPEFLYKAYSGIIMQLTGTTNDGAVHAGTGIAIAQRWILTCAHVVNDMNLDSTQAFAGIQFTIEQIFPATGTDVAVIRVSPDLPRLPGLAFREPAIAETVYTLGYPRIPLSREPSLVMQRGEVTSQKIKTFSGQELFLYSAIARPGNSGGPVIAATGHIVGIVTSVLSQEASSWGPFHTGIATAELTSVIAQLDPSIQFPVETYE